MKRNATNKGHTISKTVRFARWAWKVAWWSLKTLVKLLPPSLEVFLHRDFGDRYFPKMAGSFALFLIYRRLALLSCRAAPSGAERFFLAMYALVFLCAGLCHGVWRFVGEARGEVHSRAAGVPWPFWAKLRLQPLVVARFVEPVVCFSFARVISYFAHLLAGWLTVASVMLFLKGQMEWWTQRRRTLDAMDARIEGRQVTKAVGERAARRGAGPGRFYEAAPVQRPQSPNSESLKGNEHENE